jgi:predicted helicase
VFNLRGNQRTSGELSRKEGGKIFGSGSRTPIAITLLVKNPSVKSGLAQSGVEGKATIYYHDIGDYLSQTEKLNIVKEFGSVANEKMEWKILTPNQHGDWISLRNSVFDDFIEIVPDKKFNTKSESFFVINSNGLQSNRDNWVYNFSSESIIKNISAHIDFYNSQVDSFKVAKELDSKLNSNDFKDNDPTKISWASSLVSNLERFSKASFEKDKICESMYRPYTKQKLYYGDKMIHRSGQFKNFFPNNKKENLVICFGNTNTPACLITSNYVDSNFSGYNQCFPLYYYEENKEVQKGLFDTESNEEYIRRDGVSDYILDKATKQYKATNITKKDIFYYVYGFLHSPEYREIFANDLKKMLPRLPLVDDVKDFWSFSKAGRELAEIHLNYESVPPYEGVKVEGEDSKFFKVEKMRFPKKDQKDIIYFNSQITISNIPLEAYEYVVNGKSAIEWIMERYQITTHKESQITNDPNDWAEEVGNPRYILDLLLSIINVSMQTRDLIGKLPKMKFE